MSSDKIYVHEMQTDALLTSNEDKQIFHLQNANLTMKNINI